MGASFDLARRTTGDGGPTVKIHEGDKAPRHMNDLGAWNASMREGVSRCWDDEQAVVFAWVLRDIPSWSTAMGTNPKNPTRTKGLLP